jgi:hypothetical protein
MGSGVLPSTIGMLAQSSLAPAPPAFERVAAVATAPLDRQPGIACASSPGFSKSPMFSIGPEKSGAPRSRFRLMKSSGSRTGSAAPAPSSERQASEMNTSRRRPKNRSRSRSRLMEMPRRTWFHHDSSQSS